MINVFFHESNAPWYLWPCSHIINVSTGGLIIAPRQLNAHQKLRLSRISFFQEYEKQHRNDRFSRCFHFFRGNVHLDFYWIFFPFRYTLNKNAFCTIFVKYSSVFKNKFTARKIVFDEYIAIIYLALSIHLVFSCHHVQGRRLTREQNSLGRSSFICAELSNFTT
jgi:hypothetical protein